MQRAESIDERKLDLTSPMQKNWSSHATKSDLDSSGHLKLSLGLDLWSAVLGQLKKAFRQNILLSVNGPWQLVHINNLEIGDYGRTRSMLQSRVQTEMGRG